MHECINLFFKSIFSYFIYIYLNIDYYQGESNILTRDEHHDELKADQQRFSNGTRRSSSTYDVHRGDDFYKKLMFYETNSSSNINNNNNELTRRPSFQQYSSVPSASSKSSNDFMNISTHQISSRPNYSINISDQMHRSKSSKDFADPPIAHPVYNNQQSSSFYPSTSSYITSAKPSTINSPFDNGPLDYQQSLSVNNLIPDDVSSSSAAHLPKPPPGIPSQNAR